MKTGSEKLHCDNLQCEENLHSLKIVDTSFIYNLNLTFVPLFRQILSSSITYRHIYENSVI